MHLETPAAQAGMVEWCGVNPSALAHFHWLCVFDVRLNVCCLQFAGPRMAKSTAPTTFCSCANRHSIKVGLAFYTSQGPNYFEETDPDGEEEEPDTGNEGAPCSR